MRIEESYTIDAPAEQVYGALITPEAMARAIPGCERLIQLGPAEADGAVTFEARVYATDAIWSVTVRVRGGRRHDRVELGLRASSAEGAYSGRGAITLIRHNGQTLLSYSVAVEGSDGSESETNQEAALQEIARGFCERLAVAPHEPAPPSDDVQREGANVESDSGATLAPTDLQGIGQRAAWMVGGLLVGIAGLALLSSLARRLTRRGRVEGEQREN